MQRLRPNVAWGATPHHVVHLAHGLLLIGFLALVILLAVLDTLFKVIAVDFEVFLHALLLLLERLPLLVGVLDLLRQAVMSSKHLVVFGDFSVLFLQNGPNKELSIADFANTALGSLDSLHDLREFPRLRDAVFAARKSTEVTTLDQV